MNSLEFINEEIKITKKSYEAFDLDYRLFRRESDRRDAENLYKKLIHLNQIKTELEEKNKLKKVINFLKPHTHLALGLCEIKLADSEVSELHPKYHNNKLVYEPNYNEFCNLFLEVTNNE